VMVLAAYDLYSEIHGMCCLRSTGGELHLDALALVRANLKPQPRDCPPPPCNPAGNGDGGGVTFGPHWLCWESVTRVVSIDNRCNVSMEDANVLLLSERLGNLEVSGRHRLEISTLELATPVTPGSLASFVSTLRDRLDESSEIASFISPT
jgi:hypothetical protein